MCRGMLNQYFTKLNQVSWWWKHQVSEESCSSHKKIQVMNKKIYMRWSLNIFQRWIWLLSALDISANTEIDWSNIGLSFLPSFSSRNKWSCEAAMKPSEAPGLTVPRSPAWSSWLRSLWGRGSALWSTWQEVWLWWSSRPRPCPCSAASSSPSLSDMWNDSAYIKVF